MESTIIRDCESVFVELMKFSASIIDVGKPINDSRLEQFEKTIQYELPIDFKFFLKKINGFSLMGTAVFGIDSEYRDSSLDKIYEFEHNHVENKMPLQLLPFSNDGRGNHYCLDLNSLDSSNLCRVVFWQWDFEYESVDNIEICNESFCEWVKEEMIEWTLEEYNYDGSNK